MSSSTNISELPPPTAGHFVTTHWSVVLAAGRSDSSGAGGALAKLCEAYWYPLYAYVRRRGYTVADAQDLTQEFFARLVAGHWLNQADQQRGRFRSFLLSAMKHFLANEWHKTKTQKRGGQITWVSLDADLAENRYASEPATRETPESLYERRWACALLDTVLARLEEEYREEGKAGLFAVLKSSLTMSRGALSYAALAATLQLSEGAVRVAVHRLRQRYRHRLRAEVANTVDAPGAVEEEMQYLFRILSSE